MQFLSNEELLFNIAANSRNLRSFSIKINLLLLGIILLALPFFGTGMKTDLFQPYGHCWVFQICWHIQCSIFTTSSFRIWNSSAGIPSPPLALFIVMLPKAHLTLHSRMSGSRWVITQLWSPGSWRSFCTVLLCILAISS